MRSVPIGGYRFLYDSPVGFQIAAGQTPAGIPQRRTFALNTQAILQARKTSPRYIPLGQVLGNHRPPT